MRNAGEQSAARRYTTVLDYIDGQHKSYRSKEPFFYRPPHRPVNFRIIQINGGSDNYMSRNSRLFQTQ